MKKSILTLVLLSIYFLSVQAEDIFYYHEKFSNNVEHFKAGVKDSTEFHQIVGQLDLLQSWLIREDSIAKKEPLLSDIKAVKAFLGEISPSKESYSLTLDQKKIAMGLLDVTEELYDDTTFCMPINKIVLWDSTYTAFIADNNEDTIMYVYKLNFNLQKNYSSVTGFVEAGASRKSARGLYGSFGHIESMTFSLEKCDKEIQMIKYIQPEVVQPKIEKYPEPDYLSPQQKAALKKKQKAQLKKEKIKQKKLAKKEKERKKKEALKERMEAKKQMIKKMEAKKQAALEKKKAKKK